MGKYADRSSGPKYYLHLNFALLFTVLTSLPIFFANANGTQGEGFTIDTGFIHLRDGERTNIQ